MQRVPGPFALALADQLLSSERLVQLEALFGPGQEWTRHQDSFYRCDMADVEDVEPGFLDGLRTRVSTALDLPLLPRVTVSAQRMGPGDGSDRHTDQAAAGYEAARLVVQLDAASGGCFRAFDGEEIWVDRPPRPNQAVAFELSVLSHHDVTPCASERRTVVFHFWHPANPPDAGRRLNEWFAPMSFGDLPAELDAEMSEAEARYPDEVTFRAAAVAWSLMRLGREGVQASYGDALSRRPTSDVAAAVGWLVDLHLEGFDRTAWDQLRPVQLLSPLEIWSA